MARVQRFVFLATVFCLIPAMALFVTSCKETTTEPPAEDLTVPDDVFPLVAGRVINFSGYMNQNDTETKITATEATYFSRWTLSGTFPLTAILGPAAANVNPSTGFLIKDSTYQAGTDTTKNPQVTPGSKITPYFIRYDSATAKYSFLTNLGYFYRTFQIKLSGQTTIRSDSLRWITLADPRQGMKKKYDAFPAEQFSGTVQGQAATLTLQIQAEFDGKETLALGGSNIETYRLIASRVVSLGATTIATGTTAKVWLEKGKGIVQIQLYGDAESHGQFKRMTSRVGF